MVCSLLYVISSIANNPCLGTHQYSVPRKLLYVFHFITEWLPITMFKKKYYKSQHIFSLFNCHNGRYESGWSWNAQFMLNNFLICLLSFLNTRDLSCVRHPIVMDYEESSGFRTHIFVSVLRLGKGAICLFHDRLSGMIIFMLHAELSMIIVFRKYYKW